MAKNHQTPFAAALKFLIENRPDIDQGAIADAADVSQGFISQLKTGKKEGTEETRRQVAAVFGYEYQDFLDLGLKIIGLDESKIREGVIFGDKADAVVIKRGFGKGGKQEMTDEKEKDERIKDLKQQISDIKNERDSWRDLAQDLIRRGIRGPIIDKGENEPPFRNGGARNAL